MDFRTLLSLLSAALLILFSGCARTVQTVQTEGFHADLDSSALRHIKRIENSLYPIYTIRGEEKPKTIPEMMRESGIVGLSMAFIDNGRIAWTKCYGYANLEDSIKMTPNTILRAASLSKPVTAMAALHFVEKGDLDLDQDINQKLIGWKVPENEFTRNEKVTVSRLIGHTSGIKNLMFDGVPFGEKVPTLEDIFNGKFGDAPAEVVSVPGARHKYSNMGYMVLSELLQDVESKDFAPLMQEAVLTPCEMTNSSFSQEFPISYKGIVAAGYDQDMRVVPPYKHPSGGAGSLWTTPSDLGKFLIAILTAYHNADAKGRVISHEMAQKVFEETNDKLGFNKAYANDDFVFRHDGSIAGYNCILMGSLYRNQAVVLMLNTGSDKAYDFLNFLWRAVSMEYRWGLYEPEFYDAVDVPVEELAGFKGEYAGREDSIGIDLVGGQLEASSNATGKVPLVPIGGSAFVAPAIPMKFIFEVDSVAHSTTLYVRDERGDPRSPYVRVR